MRSATVCRFCQAEVTPEPAKKKGGPSTGVGLIILVVLVGIIYAIGNNDRDSGGSTSLSGSRRTPRPAPVVRVTYTLTGSATSADLTYTDNSGNIQQQAGVAVPLKNTEGANGISFTVDSGEFVQFSAQNQGEFGDLECEIKADGRTINTGRSSGAYTIVSCSATVP